MLLVARALVRPLRTLRDGALKVAHDRSRGGVARVKAGAPNRSRSRCRCTPPRKSARSPTRSTNCTRQALLLAGDEARLRLLVNDMFETMSRRSRSLVDQQLALIDRLERNEEDPDRLDSLFRLDHLAARLRRNSANLLVLAGAQLAREHSETGAAGDGDQRRGFRGRGLPQRRDHRPAGLRPDRRGGGRCHPHVRRTHRQRPALLVADDHGPVRPARNSRGLRCGLSVLVLTTT